MESLGRCAGPCFGPAVTTVLGAIESAGSPPLPLALEDGGGVVALRFGILLPAVGFGCGNALLGAGFGSGSSWVRNASLDFEVGIGGGVLVLSLAFAPSVAFASGAAAVDDDAVNESTISATTCRGAGAAMLVLAGVTPANNCKRCGGRACHTGARGATPTNISRRCGSISSSGTSSYDFDSRPTFGIDTKV